MGRSSVHSPGWQQCRKLVPSIDGRSLFLTTPALLFMLPVMLLLAVGSGSRVGWPRRVLILASIAICAIGVVWWLHGWCAFPT
jgi:hypothetical protein